MHHPQGEGKGVDNVFIMLDKPNASTDEGKRALYVATMPVKNSLVINTNDPEFDGIDADGLQREIGNTLYDPPRQLAVQTILRDVWLNVFYDEAVPDWRSGERRCACGQGGWAL